MVVVVKSWPELVNNKLEARLIFRARAVRYKLGTRAGKQKLGARAGEYKSGTRAGKYKLVARVVVWDRRPGSEPEARQRARGWEMQIPCFTLKLRFSHKKLCLKFHYFKIFISPDSCED